MDDAQSDDIARLLRDLEVDEPLAAAVLGAVLARLRALAVALGRDRQDLGVRRECIHADDLIAVVEADALDTAGRAAHRAHIVLAEDNGHAPLRAEDHVALAVRELDADELVIVIEVDGVEAALVQVLELDEARLLDDAFLRGHEEVGIRIEALDLDDRRDLLVLLELQQVDDGRAFRRAARLRDLVCLEMVDAAAVREEQDRVVRRRDQEVLDEILLLRRHALDALAAAVLAAISIECHALDVVVVRQRDDDVFLSDEVLDVDLARVDRQARAARIAELRLDRLELVLDDAEDAALICEDGLVVLDGLQDFLILLLDLLALEARQALQAQVQDGLSLFLRELEARNESSARDVSRAALADRRDDRIEVVERDRQALQDVGARLSLLEIVARAPRDDIFLIRNVVVQHFLEVEDLRLAVDERQHDDAEAVLQLRVLVELVEDDIRIRVAAQVDDDAHAAAVRLIIERRDALNLLVAHELRDLLDEARLVDLIRQLRDDDARLAVRQRLDAGVRAHLDDAAARRVRLADAVLTEHETCRREIRSLDDLHEVVDRRIRMVDEHQRAVDDLAHVVRRDVRRHADRDARRAVDEQLRELRRQNRRLLQRLIVVRREVDRLLVDILQHELCDLRHADLGVTHGSRRVAVDRAEVAVAVREHVAHGEILRHADDRIVDRRIAVRMIFTEDFTDDTGRFLVGLVRAHARLLHRVKDAAVYWFQAVPDIRQSTRDDDTHRIVDV